MSKRNILIKPISITDTVGIYSIKYGGYDKTEFEDFMMKFKDSPQSHIKSDFHEIIARINQIKLRGASERYFRPEGKFKDGVCALPLFTSDSKTRSGTLRLYCLRISDSILIIGNGGIKTTQSYNDDAQLNQYAADLCTLDEIIKHHARKGNITIIGNIINPESFIFYL